MEVIDVGSCHRGRKLERWRTREDAVRKATGDGLTSPARLHVDRPDGPVAAGRCVPAGQAARAFVLVVTLVVLAACTPPGPEGVAGSDAPRGGAATSSTTDRLEADDDLAPSLPSEVWPDPDPDRPVVDLRFEVATDLRTVAGTERITFRPDLPVCEVVLRAWPNKPATSHAGNALEVTGVRLDGVAVAPVLTPAGAPDGAPATLIEAPLPSCAAAGAPVTVDLTFEVLLGEGTDERLGVARSGAIAWFGTAFPLLAWERGRGWARDDAVAVPGEMATSETFELRSLEVAVPIGYEVLGVGTPLGTRDDPATGRVTHRFSAPSVRDVTVSVGDLELLEEVVEGTTLHLGVPPGTRASLDEWREHVVTAIRALIDHLGPLPYEDLWVSVVPDQSDGIEYAGAVQFGDVELDEQGWLISHELAHQWFYGLVGNNQARDPWLDEAFASFLQRLVDDRDPWRHGWHDDHADGELGRPMAFWAARERPGRAYVEGVYARGAEALVAAREAAGTEAFDAALHDYLVANAHAIATPDDVRTAFAHLPDAIEVLEAAGAFVSDR
jgi:PAS domain-containing protein